MIIKTHKQIPSSEITDQSIFLQRRQIIKTLAASLLLPSADLLGAGIPSPTNPWASVAKSAYSLENIPLTEQRLVENYTNYYEFSFNKEDSSSLAQSLNIDAWDLEISGEVETPGRFQLEDILKRQVLKEYIYRFRCVEAWSMVVPWIGFPLGDLIKAAKPLSGAKFVKLTAVHRPDVMPKQRIKAMLDWPYVEALRIDEAMHPLTILAVGMYGAVMPKQNGAPLRLIVPWKYGFKSIKAIVKIELLKNTPMTSWNAFAPKEYGFYANVNPKVPHPRWSQATERLLGSGFFSPRRRTELFNGYAEQVAGLYGNMDLKHFF